MQEKLLEGALIMIYRFCFLLPFFRGGKRYLLLPRDLSLWNRFPNSGELYLCELERETCKVEQTGTPTESADEGSSLD